MARGYPDFSPGAARTAEGEFLPTIAEPPVWYEDNFDSPNLKWLKVSGTVSLITDSGVAGQPNIATIGDALMRIIPAAGGNGRVAKYIGPPLGSKLIGMEWYFATATDGEFQDREDSIRTQFYYSDGANAYGVGWSYNPHDYKWYITIDNFLTTTYITTLQIINLRRHRVKIIFDIQTHQLRYLIIDGKIFDISAYTFISVGVATFLNCELQIRCYDVAGADAILWIDKVLLTHQES